MEEEKSCYYIMPCYTHTFDTGCNLVQPFSEQERIGKDNTYGSNSG